MKTLFTTLRTQTYLVPLLASLLLCPSAASAQTKPELVLQTGHAKSVTAIALSADGRFLVSGSMDQTLKVWDAGNAIVLRTLYGHEKAVLAVAVSPDGRWIVSGGDDATVRLWDALTGEARVLGNHTSSVKELAFSVDGRQLTSLGSNEVKLWDIAAGREVRSVKLGDQKDAQRGAAGLAGEMTGFDQTATALSADGRFAAVGGGITYRSGVLGFGGGVRAKPIKLIEIATGREITSLKLRGDMPNPTDMAFSPDGRLLVAKFTEMGAARDREGQSALIVWDVASGREVKTFQTGDQSGLGGIAFSPDGKLLASRANKVGTNAGDADPSLSDLAGSIRIFDTASWNEVRELKKTGMSLNLAGGFAATPLRFSPDGKLLAASLSDGVALFDAATGSRLRVLRTTEKTSAVSTGTGQSGQEEMMRQAGITPDQLRELRGMMGGVMDNLPGGLGGLGASRIGTGSVINFSPDGRLLSSASTSTTWDVMAGTPYQRPQPQSGDTTDMATSVFQSLFSPDGKMTATSYQDDTGASVIIKEAATQRIVQKIPIGKRLSGQSRGTQQTEVPAQVGGLAYGARGVVVQYCEFKMPGRGAMFGGGGNFMDCRVALFDPNTGQQLREFKLDHDNASLFGNLTTISPDGWFVISVAGDSGGGLGGAFGGMKPSIPFGIGGRGKNDKNEMPKQQYKMRLTELESGRRLWEIKVEGEMISPPSLIFSPAGTTLAVTSYEKNQQILNLFDTASGRKAGTLNAGNKKIATMNFSRDGKLLATTYADDNAVTLWDSATGKRLHALAHATKVSGVAFHPTRKLVATQGQDRNQYIWDLETGERLATLVNLDALNDFGNNSEWLVVTSDGLFDGSPAAWQQIMWRFSQNTFDVGPVEIFFNELYYPGVLEEVFSGKRPRAPRDLQQLDRRQPTIRVAASQPGSGEVKSRTVTVKIEVAEAAADGKHQQGSGARDVRLFRNGTLVKVWRGDVLKGQKQAALEATLPIVAGENRITAYAFNRDNVKSQDSALVVMGDASLQRKGLAWVLACGVNQYANAQYNLKYAVADATAFGDEVKAQQLKLRQFERVEVIPLLDGEATKANILLALKRLAGDKSALPANAPAALSKLQPSQPEDAVLIYFAGHGTAQGARFYLVPHDLGYNGSRTELTAFAVKMILERSISDLELEAAVEGLDAGQLLLVIDACNSGQALEAEEKRRGPMNSKGLAQLAYEKGMSILTAAQSYQAALEAAQLGHGYLTFALIEEGLKKGAADNNQKDGQVLSREWFDYAVERVPQMQEKNLGSRILLEEEKTKDPATARSAQRPRPFYRRETEAKPLIVAKP